MLSVITLFVDASHCPQSNVGGWGAWVKMNGWDSGRLFGGPFHTSLASASEAELCAIANAVTSLMNAGVIKDDVQLLVQSDSVRALGLIAGFVKGSTINNHPSGCPIKPIVSAKATSVEEKALQNIVKNTAQGPKLCLRHVRGHKAGQGRNWVNRACDRLAKQHMRSSRQRKAELD